MNIGEQLNEMNRTLGELHGSVESGFDSMGREIAELKVGVHTLVTGGHASTAEHCERITKLEEGQKGLTLKLTLIIGALMGGAEGFKKVIGWVAGGGG